jgi:hypothetical protein
MSISRCITCSVLILGILAIFSATDLFHGYDIACAEDSLNPPRTIILPDIRRDDKSKRYLLELAPYYESHKTEEDTYALGIFFSADLNENVEFQLASDTITYQKPDLGMSDILLGMRWDFFRQNINFAVIGYLELPTGSKAFAETWAEPSLLFEISKDIGDFVGSLTLGLTYLADSEDTDFYFDYSFQCELDYMPDTKNSFSIFTSGYTPDQVEDGITRILAGASYTRNLNDANSIGLSVLKGLAKRGIDWSFIVTYDYQF